LFFLSLWDFLLLARSAANVSEVYCAWQVRHHDRVFLVKRVRWEKVLQTAKATVRS